MEDSSVLQTPVKRCKNKAQFLFSGLVTSYHRVTAATSEACKALRGLQGVREEATLEQREGHHTAMCQDHGGGGGDRDQLKAGCRRSGGAHTKEPLTYRFQTVPGGVPEPHTCQATGRRQAGRMESGVQASTDLHIMLLMSPSPEGSSPAHQDFENHVGR